MNPWEELSKRESGEGAEGGLRQGREGTAAERRKYAGVSRCMHSAWWCDRWYREEGVAEEDLP